MENNIYLGIVISFVSFYVGILLAEKFKNPILNPLLIGITLNISILKIFNISYDQYMLGGQYIQFFLGPTTVLLVVPLYNKLDLLKKNLLPVLGGVIVGAFTSVLSIILLSKLMGVDGKLLISIVPKSVTTGISMPLASEFGGHESIAAFAVILTGIIGAITGEHLMKILRTDDPIVYGVMMGTSAHAMGTAKAMEIGEEEGSISGLCIGLCGIVTVILFPFFVKLI